jgi:hypothetical protein
VTKAAICTHCSDIVTPYRNWQTNRAWRWCECDHMGVRWDDGARGLIEVTALHGPDHVRVIGLNNMFLTAAVRDGSRATAEQWRQLHAECARRVEPNYLFHADRRDCWALVVRTDESGDIAFVPFATAKGLIEGSPS